MANEPKPTQPKAPITQEDLHAAITELHTAVKGLTDRLTKAPSAAISCAECTCGPCAECSTCRVCSICRVCSVCRVCNICFECTCGPCAACAQ